MISSFSALRWLLLAQADQLLEMGFRPDVTKILSALSASRESRQTLLFSATLMNDILQASPPPLAALELRPSSPSSPVSGSGASTFTSQVAQIACRPGDHTRVIDTVGPEEATHEHVPQRVTITTIQRQARRCYRGVVSGEGSCDGSRFIGLDIS